MPPCSVLLNAAVWKTFHRNTPDKTKIRAKIRLIEEWRGKEKYLFPLKTKAIWGVFFLPFTEAAAPPEKTYLIIFSS